MVVVGAAANDKDGQLLKPSSNRLEVNASEPSEQPVAQQPVLDSVEGTSRGSVACMLTDLLTEPSWHAALSSEFAKAYFGRLQEFVQSERAVHQVFPPEDQVFRAFNSCPFDQVASRGHAETRGATTAGRNCLLSRGHTSGATAPQTDNSCVAQVKVVIIGQDPYHQPGNACGLSFSVPPGVKVPSSLQNIFKEIREDIGCPKPTHGSLDAWARQGVLLLNAVLTVRANTAASHSKKGWENLTDAAITQLSEQRTGLVFLLWGKFAQDKAKLIDGSKHHVLMSAHPSGLSAHRGFFGCRHFSKTNAVLAAANIEPIDWCI